MNVFISWRGSDRAIKDKIVKALREQLDPDDIVWESDENVNSDAFKEFIEQIRKSQVFIVIISDAAMEEDSYVRNEVHEARICEMKGDLNIVLYKVTDNPLTPEFAAEINHISDANHVARMMGTDAGIQGVINRTRNLLARRKRGEPEKPFDVFEPEIKGVNLKKSDRAHDGFFVEDSRDTTFEELDRAFERSNVVFASQMSGYGKKSAVRKYAELHEEEYKNIIHFHYFTGSIREFFLTGLEFANVNEAMFERGDDKSVILRKLEFLKKLGKDTLLIVPDVAIDRRDDIFILDVLSQLSCRAVFITQNLPEHMKKRFPWLDVGRMEDEYLEEIFYHYYSDVDEMEKEELKESLTGFFDYIDGHTKSVEVTAKALADEYGVYPEDIPGILADIHKGAENELADRILGLITEMFDLSQFDEREQKILFTAGLVARIPIDEKQFAELLKQCGIYDASALKKLQEKGWIDRSRQTRTISMEQLLLEVCLKQIPMDQELAGQCLEYLLNQYVGDILGYKRATAESLGKRMEYLFDCLGIEGMDRLAAISNKAMDQMLVTESKENIEWLVDRIRRQISRIQNPHLKEQANFFVDIHEEGILASLALTDPKVREKGGTLDKEVYNMMIGTMGGLIDNLDEYTERYGENPLFDTLRNFWNLMISGDQTKVVTEYMNIAEPAIEALMEEEYGEEFVWYIAAVGRNLCQSVMHIPYVCVRLCRVVSHCYDITGFTSGTEAYLFYSLYLNSLCKLDDSGEEMYEVMETVLTALKAAEKEFFPNRKDAEEQRSSIYYQTGHVLIRHYDMEKAEGIYHEMKKVPMLSSDIAYNRVAILDEIVNAYMEKGEVEDALRVLREELTKELMKEVLILAGKEDCEHGMIRLQELYNLKELLETPFTDHGFEDASYRYMDYYRTYGGNVFNKFQMKKYCDIADKAKALSLEEKTDEELLGLADELRARAKKGARWDKLAPEAFALVSESGRRALGYKHHYVQYIGGAAIADGKIAEIKNGEGKTYTIILAAFLQSLYGKQVHIMDTSDYLAERNYHWMKGTLEAIGCRVGYLSKQSSKVAGMVNAIAACDVIYESAERAMYYRMAEEVEEGTKKFRYDVAIIDEADTLLIQNGAKSYGIPKENETVNEYEFYQTADQFLQKVSLQEDVHYIYRSGNVTLKPALYEELETFLECSIGELASDAVEKLEWAIMTGITVYYYYRKNIDYIVVGRNIKLENKRTGALDAFNARYRYFLGKKEKMEWLCEPKGLEESVLANYYVVREFLTLFSWIAGTTATASSYRKELKEVYQLQVVEIPTNIRIKRVDYDPVVFSKKSTKLNHILDLVDEKHEKGQPVLVICDNIDESEFLTSRIRELGMEVTLLNAKSAHQEAAILGEAGRLGKITVATALANRGVDIRLGGNPQELAKRHLLKAGTKPLFLDRAIHSYGNLPLPLGELRKKYEALTVVYRAETEKEKKQVEETGGLCVIGTTCFDSLSTEQQMRGRSGRQGEAGESYVFFSLYDDCIKLLLGDRMNALQGMISRLNVEEEMIESPMLNKSIYNARQKLQNMRFKTLNSCREMNCHRLARKEILGLLEDAASGKRTPEMILKTYGADKGIRGEVLVQQVKKAFGEEYGKRFTDELKKRLAYGWAEYILDMKREAASSKRIFNNQTGKAEAHLVEFSKNMAKQKVETAIEEIISMTNNS